MSLFLSIDRILEFLLFVKLLFIFFYLGHWISEATGTKSEATGTISEATTVQSEATISDATTKTKTKQGSYSFWYYWKTKTEFVFNMGASLLLMYFFNPFVPPKTLNRDVRLLFCLFGFFFFLNLLPYNI